MSHIRVVWGSGTGPTKLAAYDAALADAGVENYNLVTVSSVVPGGVPVEATETAPDLGPIGNRLTVVEACATVAGAASATAALGWCRRPDDGPGLFYECAGEIDGEEADRRIREGLDAGLSLRGWDGQDRHVRVERASAPAGTYASAVVLAVYGESTPIVGQGSS